MISLYSSISGTRMSNTRVAKAFAILSEEVLSKGIRSITATTTFEEIYSAKEIDLKISDAVQLDDSTLVKGKGRAHVSLPPTARRTDTLNDLLAASDLMFLHCALTNETVQIINAECLQQDTTDESMGISINLMDLVDIDVFRDAKKVIDSLQSRMTLGVQNKSRLKKSKVQHYFSKISEEALAHGVTSEMIRAFLKTEHGHTSHVKEDLLQPQTTTTAKISPCKGPKDGFPF
ncbi:hypothetical protein C5167_030503 [Papaver somniferum]|nr:hypothetical protein C5167_030503 [Papaver somniferum]